MEFTLSSLAMLAWFICVPMVAWGGLVVPMVPVAMTAGGKLCAVALLQPEINGSVMPEEK